MLKTLLIGGGITLLLVGGALIYATSRPDKFHLQRSVSIAAPPDKVFALIQDFRTWAAWSPFESKDPAMLRSYGALTNGAGATYAWRGNKYVGHGKMEIIEAVPPRKLMIKLEFQKPGRSQSIEEFTLQPEGEGTLVVWKIHGRNTFVTNVMMGGWFFDMDARIGKEFEAGLANLKKAAETP